MPSELQRLFEQLRAILTKNASEFVVAKDSPGRFVLEARPGPATLRAWRGELKRPGIPVAWVELRKGGVSYHLMPLGNAQVRAGISKQLVGRLDGKTCFTFTTGDEDLFRELDRVTAHSLLAFRKAGFISSNESA